GWTRPMSCDAIRDELDAYALGSLDREGERAIERHLATCPDCRRLAADTAAAAHALPLALANASPLVPSEALRDRLLPPPAAPPVAAAPLPDAHPATSVRHRARGIGRQDGRGLFPSVQRRWLSVAAAVLVLAVVGSLVWNARLSAALDHERATR